MPSQLTYFRFLLAQLHLDSLSVKTTPKEIKRALGKLPKGSEALENAYKKAMERIEGQEDNFRKLAKRILSWITHTRRPVTTLELRHALAVEVGEPKLDEDNLTSTDLVVSVCAGLVAIDEKSDIIRLVHYTTQEYFERVKGSWIPDAQRDITMTCVTYLSFDAFDTGFCSTDETLEERLQLNPLYDYAARNWGYHAAVASAEVDKLIVSFLESEAKVSSCSQAMMASRCYSWASSYNQHVPRRMTAVHLAAYFGLEEATRALLKKGYDPDSKDTYGYTPLLWTARNGNEVLVKLLLENGAVLESKDNKWGQTPLSWAARYGNEAVVKVLLEKGANLESKDNKFSGTPLLWAAVKGHEAVAKLLLEKGAKLEPEDNIGETPLSWAARYGHEAVVELLLEKGAKLESKDNKFGRTPLLWAAFKGHKAVVKLLLEKGAKLEPEDNIGETPLSWAARYGHEAVVELLLEKGAKLESKDNKFGRTLLLWAALKGHEAVVELMLEEGLLS